jgi:ABC-type transporter Mla MlaB component
MASHERSTVAFVIQSPIERSDLPELCERMYALLEASGASVAYCDVSDAHADAVTVDALARLQLAAGRSGCQVRLRHACSELRTLITLMGLEDILAD